MSYAEYQVALGPPWLKNTAGAAWAKAHGQMKDALTGLLVQAVQAADIQTADEAALLLRGAERGITHFVDEPLDIYRARVLGAWEYWQWAGTVRGIEVALNQAGYHAQVIEHFRDPDPAHWAEFSVIVRPVSGVTLGGDWDDGAAWDDGASWNFKLPATPLAGLLDLLREVKPAHARLRRLLLDTWDNTWDGAAVWGADDDSAVQHNWGSPWGLPSVVFTNGAGTAFAWDDSRYETVYEMEGLDNAENN